MSINHVVQKSVEEEFKLHVKDKINSKILFSAPFGTGKSTFLEGFFAKNKKDFLVLNLSPINYAVAQNEDVFEYIKYDLLFELLKKFYSKLGVEDNDFKCLEALEAHAHHTLYHSKNLAKSFKPLIKSVLKFGGAKGQVANQAIDFVESAQTHLKTEIENLQNDDGKKLLEYFKWVHNQKGSIYEMDQITYLIVKYVRNLKKNSKGKKVVLLVDDLDRLDPEHLFRLINIFSSHYKGFSSINKFEVDKLIFVGDYKNIQLIYHHRYGDGVDFTGYIDKFFSTKYFEFDNKTHFQEAIYEILVSKPFNKNVSSIVDYELRYENPVCQAFVSILGDLINIHALTFRKLNQSKGFDMPDNLVTHTGYNPVFACDLPFLVIMHWLQTLFTLKELEIHFELLSSSFKKLDPISLVEGKLNLINYCAQFIFEGAFTFQHADGSRKTSKLISGHTCEFSIVPVDTSKPLNAFKINNTQVTEKIDVYGFVLDVIDKCKRRRYLGI